MKKKKEKEIEYVLHLNPTQMRYIATVCEFFARIVCGQFDEFPWFVINNKGDGYADKRDLSEPLLKQLKQIYFPELGWNASFGVGHDDYSDIPWDIYQVVRNKIAWTENPDSDWKGVDYCPPMRFSSQPLPTCEVYIDGIKTNIPDGNAY